MVQLTDFNVKPKNQYLGQYLPTRAREGVTRKQHFAERLNLVEQDRSTLRERYRK